MGYTAPRTWVHGELVTDAMLNEQLRDNMIYMYQSAGKRVMIWRIVSIKDDLSTGNGKDELTIPADLDGWDLVDFDISIDIVSSSGDVSAQLRNKTDSVDMLSTNATIDVGELSSYTASVPPVIDTAHDDVSEGDVLAADVDADGTGVKGLTFIMAFQKP